MKKHLKLLVLVLTLVLVIGAVAIIAGAEETETYVAQVGDTKYTSVYDAYISLPQAGGTITLINNATIDKAFGAADGKTEGIPSERKNKVIFDLNGYTLTTTVYKAIQNHYNYDISIIGEGEIVAKAGPVLSTFSDSADGYIRILGSGKGIKVTSTGAPVSAHRGYIQFKNVDFNITMTAAGAAFEAGVSAEKYGFSSANYEFDNCTVNLTQTVNSSGVCVFKYKPTGKTGSIKITNSYFKFSGPFIFDMNSTVANAVTVENSVITQQLSNAQVKDSSNDGRKTNFIYGNPNGGFNFKNCHIEYAFRFLAANSSANLVNSKLVFTAQPYELTGGDNMIARYGTVNFDKDSELVACSAYNISMNTTDAKFVFAEGARVHHATEFVAANCLFPDGSATNSSTTYKFMYDPVGDSDSPYVVVKADAASKLPAGATSLYDFSDLRIKSLDGIIINNGVSAGDATGAFSHYNISPGKSGTTNPDGGSLALLNLAGNRAIKYWVSPTDTITSGNRSVAYDGSNSPCLFLNAADRVLADNKVIVNSYDFASENGVYPTITIRLSVDGKDNGKTNELFKLNSNGSLTNATLKKDDTVNDTFYDVNTIKASTTGEWNRVTVVVYTATKLAHVYFNDMYIGSTNCYKSANVPSKISGFRLDAAKTQPIGANILMDNVISYGFTEYAAADNVEGKVVTSAYLPNFAMNSLINESVVVGGQVYDNIEEAFKAAKTLGVNAKLIGDLAIPQTVKTNGTLLTNGYNVNISADSIGYKNVNGVYIFDSSYHVKYAFQTGTNADGTQIFTNAEIGLNVIPDAPEGSIAKLIYKKNEVNGKYQSASHIGWTATPGKDTPDTLAPVTMEDVEKYDGQTLYLYPVYGSYSDMDYAMVVIDTATGNFKRGYSPASDLVWGSRLRDELKLAVGETLVLCSSAVRWSDGFNQCTFAKGEVCIDLNGYTMNINGASNDLRKISSFFTVKEGMTLNVYSSRQGGKIKALGLLDYNISHKKYWMENNAQSNGGFLGIPADAYTSGTSGGSLFNLNPANLDHASNNGDTNMNAHINIGVYKGMYAGNLTIEAANVAAANAGDKTCSITVDGATIIRNSADFTAAIMTRFFYGTVTVKNSILYSAVDYAIFGAHGQAATFETNEETGKKTLVESPVNNFNIDNCFIIVKVNGGRIFGHNTEAMGTVTITNSVTNGNIQPSSNYKKNIIAGEGVCAYRMEPSAYAEGVVPAAYNVPMTVDGGSLAIPYIFVESTKATPGTIKYEADIQNLIYNVASYGATEAADLVLPLLTYKTVKAEDAVKVTFKGIGTNADVVVDYAKGGNVAAVDLDDATLNAFKLVFTGFEVTLPENVQENVTVTPTYEVKSNISGVKVNLSIYSDFVINLYVPVAYKNYIASITEGETVLNQSTVTLEDGEYIKVVIKRASNEATTDAVFTINLAEGEYTKAVTVTVSIASYAEAILEGETYTAEDKQLMYYMLTYANEAFKYFGDKTNYNATITALLETYATAKGEGMAEQTYAKAIENLAFGKVITEATVDLGAAPAFVFTVANGFEGTITVSYAGNTKTLTVKDGKAIVTGMKVYNFGADVIVTAEGTVNGENVTETATYNLDTFVKYHVNNEAAESQACVALLKALYDYVTCADLYTKA